MPATSRTRGKLLRATRAGETRLRVLEAATRLFEGRGYLETTMADIARESNVAVQTLYLSFGSKVAMLSRALDIAIAGDDEPVPVIERPWFVRSLEETEAELSIRLFVRGAAEVIVRHYALFSVIKAASADPEVGALLDSNKTQRYDVHQRFARNLVKKPGLRDDISARDVAASIYALVSPESYGLLVGERGWAKTRWVAWTADHLSREMLAPGQAASTRSMSTPSM